MEIREMKKEDKAVVLSYVKEFYDSDAVCGTVPEEKLERSFEAAVSADPILKGYVFAEGQEIVGFAYLTFYYACEVGGKTLMVEEVFMRDSCRGKGYGTQFFEWMFENFPEIKRFRLEVTAGNEKAKALYKKLGFKDLSYDQMVLDTNA